MNSRNRAKASQAKNAAITGASKALLGQAGGQVEPVTEEDWQIQQEAFRAAALQQVGATLAVIAPALTVLTDQLQQQVYGAMVANGFWEGSQDNFGQKVALVHSELSEMLEANRKAIANDDKIPEFTGEEAEAADVLIRLLDMAGRYRWRLGEALVAKMQHNLTRPYKHNKQY